MVAGRIAVNLAVAGMLKKPPTRQYQQPPAFAPQRHVQTIEKTGKQYKAMMAIGVLAVLGGIVMMIGQSPNGGLVSILGFLLYVIARISAWWNHG